MDLWKTVFLYNPLVFRFHDNLPGCMLHKALQIETKRCPERVRTMKRAVDGAGRVQQLADVHVWEPPGQVRHQVGVFHGRVA